MRCVKVLPQNVDPRVNHWRPDAKAKSVGVVDLSTPLTAPNRRPDTPVGECQWPPQYFLSMAPST